MEIWKDIKGYEGMYQVSNIGRVVNIRRNNIRKSNIGTHGYSVVTLSNKCKIKTHLIHRLVAEAFIPNLDNKKCINHKDGNKHNNHIENLEWVTYSENHKHAYANNLMDRKRWKELGRKLGMSRKGKSKEFKENHYKGKVIVRYSKNGELIDEFLNAKEASKVLNIPYNTINKQCRCNSIPRKYDFYFRFKE